VLPLLVVLPPAALPLLVVLPPAALPLLAALPQAVQWHSAGRGDPAADR